MIKLTRILCFIIFMMGVSFVVSAQYMVTGHLYSGDSKSPVEFATIGIFDLENDQLIGGGMSELGGSFSIESKAIPSYAMIEFLGYESLRVEITPKSGKSLDLGNIYIAGSSIKIDEIQVVEQKSTSQFLLDRKVFNVGSDIATRGGTAQEVLDNVPSLSVDVEGNVALRGSNNVRILINGKPSGLVGISGTNGLRNIQANQIERIEVITNPSARYDAEGTAGIINIVLKKDNRSGFNGSVELNGGWPWQYGGGANLNYRKGMVNFFVNYGVNRAQRPGGGYSYTEFYDGDTTRVTNVDRKTERLGVNQSVRTGLDLFLPNQQNMTFSFGFANQDSDNLTKLTYRDLLFTNQPVNRSSVENLNDYTLRLDNEKEVEDKWEYAVDYKKQFAKKDHTFSANVQYQSNGELESSKFNNTLYLQNAATTNLLDQRSSNNEREKSLNLQSDYVHPLGGKKKVELGQRTTIRDITNDYMVETLSENTWVNEKGLSNDFSYKENVHAGYAIFSDQMQKWSYQAGLRAEVADIVTNLVTTNQGNDSLYVNLFPSGFLSYKLTETDQVQGSYSRRIRRPGFRELNPFFTFSDDRNFFTGNPFLRPEITDAYELGYLKYWENSNLNSSVYYRRTTNSVNRFRIVDANLGTSVTKPENLGMQVNVGFEFLYGINPAKWLKINAEANVFYFRFYGDELPTDLQVDNIALTGRFNTKVTLSDGTDFQIRTNYRGPQDNPQGRRKAVTSIDLGLSRDFLKNNLTATLSVRDLLNQRKWRFSQLDDDFYSDGEFQWSRNSVTLSLNYRINKKKEREQRTGGRPEIEGGGEF